MSGFPYTCPDCGGSTIEITADQKLYFEDGNLTRAAEAEWDGGALACCSFCDWDGYADELAENGEITNLDEDDETLPTNSSPA